MAAEKMERIRQALERVVSDETATYLMDRPPGGWNELVTRDVLHAEIGVVRAEIGSLRHELLAEIERRFRTMTLFLTSALITGLGVVGAIVRI